MACASVSNSVFDASSSTDPDGDELKYLWDFGDGNKRNGSVVNHTYNRNGTYDVSVVIDDQTNTACSTAKASFKAAVNSSPVPIIKVH